MSPYTKRTPPNVPVILGKLPSSRMRARDLAAFTAPYGLADPDEAWLKVDQASRTAIALDSNAASPWLTLAGGGHVVAARPGARERIARAQALDSLDPDVSRGTVSVIQVLRPDKQRNRKFAPRTPSGSGVPAPLPTDRPATLPRAPL